MPTATMKWIIIALCELVWIPSSADVTVQFEQPDHYTDLSLGGSSSQSIQDDLLKQIEKHFKRLGERFLPKGDVLNIDVRDIDMAGAVEPWQTPNLSNTRIIRDVYLPKITLHYVWHDQVGVLKADKQETVTDLNYLMMLDSRLYNNNDPLRYEKAMLDRWFERSFNPIGLPAE